MWNFVVPLNHLIERLEFEDVQNGSENLCLNDLGIVVDFHNGWQDIVAIHVIERFSTIENLSSLLLDFLDTIEIVLYAPLGVEWTKQCVVVEWVAHSFLEGWVSFHHSSNEVIIDIFVDEKTSQCCASLSTSSNSTEDRALQSKLLITIWHDNGGIVASKFEDRLSKTSVHLR